MERPDNVSPNDPNNAPTGTPLVGPITNPEPVLKPIDDRLVVEKRNPIGFSDFTAHFSDSMMGIFDDLYSKPHDQKWPVYIIYICKKDDRYNYVAIFFILIFMYILLLSTNS